MMAESTSLSVPHQFRTNGTRKTHLGRSDSLISLARAPFSVQLHRLTSLSLPSPESLHTRILDPQDPAESLAHLRNIATDVQKWINTASTVLSQLDADDDVEWAARGKDSLAKVENAARRFGEIVEMFLDAATILSARSDDRVKEEIKELISIMDQVTHGWSGVRDLLKGLKEQVALSTEWMEIREILDDISSELDSCANMVFELEEMRHINRTRSSTTSSASSPSSSTELAKLTNMLEDNNTGTTTPHQSALLRLSARIQPLRASLDFLKPRLSSFTTRAEKIFPTALNEVVRRKGELEKRWSKVEADWRSIEKEFQEDEWVEVFRNVGKQATDMMDSISRSVDALSAYLPDSTPPFDLLENFIAKKTYYPAAITRVLGVLDRGHKQRDTINGEITRNFDDLRNRWAKLQIEIQKTEEALRKVEGDVVEKVEPRADIVENVAQEVKNLSLAAETRPQSSGSTSSNTTLTQGAVSPTGRTSSRDSSSIRSGARISSLPSQRRESAIATPRTRSVSQAPPSSRSSRLNIPIFTPRSKAPSVDRGLQGVNTGTGGLIPLAARPRWNSSPIASVIGSTPPKLPTVIVTPSRIPRSGRQTPTKLSKIPTPPSSSSTLKTPNRRTSMAAPSLPPPSTTPRTLQKRNSMVPLRSVSTNTSPTRPAVTEDTPPVPKIPDIYSKRQTVNFSSNTAALNRISAIPRPSTAHGFSSRSVSSPASGSTGQLPQPRWRG